MSEIDKKLQLLIETLNKNDIIKKILAKKAELPQDLILKLKDSSLTLENKKDIIYSNKSLTEYHQLLNELNYIIFAINKKLKFNSKQCGSCK